MFLKYFVACVVLVSVIECSKWQSRLPSVNPIHPNKCHFQREDIYIEKGTTITVPGKCESVTCNDDFTIQGEGCSTRNPGEGVKLSMVDLSKPFPDCCPH